MFHEYEKIVFLFSGPSGPSTVVLKPSQSMSDPQAAPPVQPLQILAQMLAQMATGDHAAAQQEQMEQLQDRADRQTQVLEQLVGPLYPGPPVR